MIKDRDFVATETQVRLTKRSPEYWRVTFDHPPLNIFDPEMLPRVNEIITALETDQQVKVVVFDSAVEGFFLLHLDFLAKLDDLAHLPPGPTGLHPWPEMLMRLALRSSRSLRFADERLVWEVSFHLPATCVLPVAKEPSYRSLKPAPAWCPAAAPWRS